jgi:hypothetical protein
MKNFKAIQYLYPNVEFTMTDDDVSTIIWNTKGITTPTDKEIQDALKAMKDAETKAISDKESAKTSALAKLEKLGLTAEEIQATFNI